MSVQLYNVINKNSELSSEVWENFVSNWEEKRIYRGGHLIKNGQVEKSLYFVLSGVLRAYILKNGQEQTIGFSYDNDFSGGYDSFLSRKETLVNIVAESDCCLLQIRKEKLEQLFSSYHELESWGRKFNEQLVLGISMQQIYFLTLNAEQRFARFMRDSSHLLQMVAQKHIASYLGMAPETFSRIRKSYIS